MTVGSVQKSIQSLSGEELRQLSAIVFPFLEKSEIALVAREIDFCLVSTHPGYTLTYPQALRANQWLRVHGYDVAGLVTDKAELN